MMSEKDEPDQLNRVTTFFQQLEHHARTVFGDSQKYHRIKSICTSTNEDCRRLFQRGTTGAPTVAIVGKVGAGKSWLARCFLENHPENHNVRSEIVTGQNHTQRSNRLTWLGSEQPTQAESGERFLYVSRERMLDLGRPYVVGDTPGFSDGEKALQMLSSVAVSSAPLKILVLSISELRDSAITSFIGKMDGTIVLPVIRFDPEPAESDEPAHSAQSDVLQQMSEWRRIAPAAQILEPCYMPNTRVFSGDAEAVMKLRLQRSLSLYVADLTPLKNSVERQVQARLKLAQYEASGALKEFRSRVGSYVDKLEEMSLRLPDHLLKELLGEDDLLRAATRRQLRADWISRTPSLCFPYRSFLGVLALTSGAWDRLILSVMGSVPSWGMTLFQSMKNVRESRKYLKRIREGATVRVQRLMQDELRGELHKFRTAIKANLPEVDVSPLNVYEDDATLDVVGLDKIDGDSRVIIRTAVDKYRIPPAVPRIFAAAATAVFWILFAPPVAALYQSYLIPLRSVIAGGSASWTEFPTHTASMLFTSLMLSAGPVFLIALFGISLCCGNKRESLIVKEVRMRHQRSIDERFENGSLRIELSDPCLNSARFLLTLPSGPLI